MRALGEVTLPTRKADETFLKSDERLGEVGKEGGRGGAGERSGGQSVYGTINSSRPEHTKRTQGNAEQHKATHAGQAEPTQPKQHQQTKNQHRGSRTLLETTNDRKPKPTHQPQAAPIETTTQGLPQPHRPSQPNLPRTTLDPTRHPRQHRTRTSNVQAPHGITPCGVCARYSAA